MGGGKPSLGLLIGVGKPKRPGAGDDAMGDDMEMPEEEESPDIVAARGFMDAVKSDDPQAVIDALKTLMDAVDVEEDAAESEGMGEDSPLMGEEV